MKLHYIQNHDNEPNISLNAFEFTSNISRQTYNTSMLRNDIMLSSLSEPASPRFSSTFNEFVNSTTTYNSSGHNADLDYNNNYIVINSSLSAPQSPHPFSRANGGFQSYNNDSNTMSTLLSNHIHKALASSSTSSSTSLSSIHGILSDGWSPGHKAEHSYDELLINPFQVKGKSGVPRAYSSMVEVPWICVDKERLSHAARLLREFR